MLNHRAPEAQEGVDVLGRMRPSVMVVAVSTMHRAAGNAGESVVHGPDLTINGIAAGLGNTG